jgi:hypothetical protein
MKKRAKIESKRRIRKEISYGFIIRVILIVLLALMLIATLIVLKIEAKQHIRPAPSVEDFATDQEKIDNATEKIDSLRDKETRDYMMKQWAGIIKKSPIMSQIDAALSKVSILFRIFIGEKYELSLTFFVIVIFYIWFTLWMSELLSLASFFPKGTTLYVAFGISIVLAQFHLFKIFIDFVIKLVFYPETWWIRTLIMFLFILIVVILEYTGKYVSKYYEEKRKRELEDEAKLNVKKMKAYIENAVDSGEAQD